MKSKGNVETIDVIAFLLITLLISSFVLVVTAFSKIENLEYRIGKAEARIIEQQAFIRNQRNVDQDIWDMLNQHSEHIGLIWERIP